MTEPLHPADIRGLFSSAMSAMYRDEVPLYGTLIKLVRDVNAATLAADPGLKWRLAASGELGRLDVERHGAIRLGTAAELAAIRRMFAVMGMAPVGYYDLSVAGIPVHSTAFRPVEAASLARNPFRVFTSLLRLDLLADRDLAATAERILHRRQIITPEAMALIARAEADGGLGANDARRFVSASLETFRWHRGATVDAGTYAKLHDAHRLIADVVSFKGPHINHLTPRTLDIDTVQAQMPACGIAAKAVVEGPPPRAADVLLRQTSFKALEEAVRFVGADNDGTHTARFGEIEQRGVALTPQGRALYDQALAETRAEAQVAADGSGADAYSATLSRRFAILPDDFNTLRQKGLAFFRYRPGPNTARKDVDRTDTEAMIRVGVVIAEPQTYEDFLPVSAAGIFQSNLGSDAQSTYSVAAHQDTFEDALGAAVIDPMGLYANVEKASLSAAVAVP
jgi:uncharacterized glyoxalase superfamily metalloenzyme YdcJ